MSTESPEINIERIRARVNQDGHDVLGEKVRSRYFRTLELLKDYFDAADNVFIWDNSTNAQSADDGGMKELVRKVNGLVEISEDAQDVEGFRNTCSRDYELH